MDTEFIKLTTQYFKMDTEFIKLTTQYFNLPYRVVCLGMAAMCASIVYFLEVYVVEYHEDLDACEGGGALLGGEV